MTLICHFLPMQLLALARESLSVEGGKIKFVILMCRVESMFDVKAIALSILVCPAHTAATVIP